MRKPLMAGNWKMNLNHLEAIAVAQKLVYQRGLSQTQRQARAALVWIRWVKR